MNPPTPAEVLAARKAARLTQPEAARLVNVTRRTWAAWEAPRSSPHARTPHPGTWELFRIKTNQA